MSLGPEARLLLLLGEPRPSQAARRAANALIEGPVDWARFARLSLRHAIAPLMHDHLGADPRVPAAVRDGLATVASANRTRHFALTAELTMIARAAAGEGIPIVSVKGPLLALDADGAPGRRIICDLDLLIRPDDAPAMRRILDQRGFSLTCPIHFTQVEEVLNRPADGMSVELHHRLDLPTMKLGVDTAGLLDRAVVVAIPGARLLRLDAESELLYLAYHGAKHGWTRIGWLTGFLAMLRRWDGGAEALAARVREAGLDVAFGSALAIARERMLCDDLPGLAPGGRRAERFANECVADAFKDPDPPTLAADTLLQEAAARLSATALFNVAGKRAPACAELAGLKAPGLRNWRMLQIHRSLGGRSALYAMRTLVRRAGDDRPGRAPAWLTRPPRLLRRLLAHGTAHVTRRLRQRRQARRAAGAE